MAGLPNLCLWLRPSSSPAEQFSGIISSLALTQDSNRASSEGEGRCAGVRGGVWVWLLTRYSPFYSLRIISPHGNLIKSRALDRDRCGRSSSPASYRGTSLIRNRPPP